MPVAISQIFTVFSLAPDAIRSPFEEKAIDVSSSLWPSSVCNCASQLFSMFFGMDIHSGLSLRKSFLRIDRVGANVRPEI